MYDLDARRWVPKPSSRYRIDKVFKAPDFAFEGLGKIDELEVGDVLSFKIHGVKQSEYIAISFLYDSSNTKVWDSYWYVYLDDGKRKQKIGEAPYSTLARMFSDIPSIKFNWDKSFEPFTDEMLSNEDCWQYERAMEHFFPNFLVSEI